MFVTATTTDFTTDGIKMNEDKLSENQQIMTVMHRVMCLISRHSSGVLNGLGLLWSCVSRPRW